MQQTQTNRAQQAAAVGQSIRQHRFAAGLSQQELGGVARVDRGRVASWEHGLSLPSGGQLTRIAKWLNLRWVPADLRHTMQALRLQQRLPPERLARQVGLRPAALRAFETDDGDLGYRYVHAIWLALRQPAWEPAAEQPAAAQPAAAASQAHGDVENAPTHTKRSQAARHGWQKRLCRKAATESAAAAPRSYRRRPRKQPWPQRAALPSGP